jgi:hypothetical protein
MALTAGTLEGPIFPPQRMDIGLTRSGVEEVGIRVKRDSGVSVVYAEGLNSAKSSATLQSTDRHGILGQKPAHLQVSL